MFNRFFAGFAFIAVAGAALAQNTPVGKWHTIDDQTKEVKSEVTITESNGVLTGKITKLLRKDAKQDAVCDDCKDARKGQPIVGLEIIRGARKEANEDVWANGKILNPEGGTEYSLKMTPQDGGKKLAVRGSFGFIGKTQIWVRTQ
jgi:uncharacterized protein (DUF2147 family)